MAVDRSVVGAYASKMAATSRATVASATMIG